MVKKTILLLITIIFLVKLSRLFLIDKINILHVGIGKELKMVQLYIQDNITRKLKLCI